MSRRPKEDIRSTIAPEAEQRRYGDTRGRLQAPALRAAALGLMSLFLAGAPAPSPAAPQPAEITLLALGDSLTAGYMLPEKSAFPAVLEAALRSEGYRVRVVNAGVSGDTASGGLARLDWALGDGAAAAIVELGANDMLRGVDPNVTRTALDAILARLQAARAKTLLAGMLASANLDDRFRTAFNAIYPELAAKYGVALYPFFLQGVAGRRDLLLQDGMHPNPAGVETVVRNILPSVRALLAELGQSAAAMRTDGAARSIGPGDKSKTE